MAQDNSAVIDEVLHGLVTAAKLFVAMRTRDPQAGADAFGEALSDISKFSRAKELTTEQVAKVVEVQKNILPVLFQSLRAIHEAVQNKVNG